MLEKEKVEMAQLVEFVDEYLYGRGISSDITENPRYKTILWKIANILRKSGKKPFFPDSKETLNSITTIGNDGSIIIIEGANRNGNLISSKYYIDVDGENEVLRKIKVEASHNRDIKSVAISSYNDDGIEDCVAIKQNLSYGTSRGMEDFLNQVSRAQSDSDEYLTKTTRVPNRTDMIRIERCEKSKGKVVKLSDIYQIRMFQVGQEDIAPEPDDLDPFGMLHMDVLGMPEIYRDLSFEEMILIQGMNGKILPLPEGEREKRFQEYQRLNKKYGRTRAFEPGMAKEYIVKNKDYFLE